MDAIAQVLLEYDLVCGAIKRLVARESVPSLTEFADLIDHRNIDGSGFVTVLAEEIPIMFAEAVDGDVNGVGGIVDEVEPVGFVVMVERGRLKWIEGFTYSGNGWPQFNTFELSANEDGDSKRCENF